MYKRLTDISSTELTEYQKHSHMQNNCVHQVSFAIHVPAFSCILICFLFISLSSLGVPKQFPKHDTQEGSMRKSIKRLKTLFLSNLGILWPNFIEVCPLFIHC